MQALIGCVNDGMSPILCVIDDMRAPSARWPEKRIAIELSGVRIRLNRDQLHEHIAHCQEALKRFSTDEGND